MLDIRYLRENVELVQKITEQKGCKVDVQNVLDLESLFRGTLKEVETLRQQRNELADKSKNAKPTPDDIELGRSIKTKLADLEVTLTERENNFKTEFKKIPNVPSPDVPVGFTEDENVVDKVVGEKRLFTFPIKNHFQIAEAKNWIDKERAAKVSGARFAYLKGDLVRLEWALMNFATDILSDEDTLKKIISDNGLNVSSKPFTPVLPPYMIRTAPYEAMDRLEPREERYKIEGEDLWLQGSAEHVLGSMHQDEIFQETEMPVRYVGFATSFRKEAGSAGKDMEGIIRLHQFNKLEMESFCTKETGMDEHLFMVAIQEYILAQLGLPYRVVKKCTFDIGKPNARGIDMDVWLPGQDKYRETHTADYMTDYQARRLNTRVRRKNEDLELIYTNDATVLSQRPMVAILENYQMENGDVEIPTVLQPYMKNKKFI